MTTETHAAEPATIADLQAIVAALTDFWGKREVLGLHHALFVHEFGDTARVIRGAGGVLAYLLGFVGPTRTGYIHVVAVREDRRGDGLARALYADFEGLAHARGARSLKAITRADNRGSIAFHRALGFSAREIAGYTATGEPRVLFTRKLT